MFCSSKKDDFAQIEKSPACSEGRVSKKAHVQFRDCAIITWRGGGGGGSKWVKYGTKIN